jgi:hypothetical protein
LIAASLSSAAAPRQVACGCAAVPAWVITSAKVFFGPPAGLRQALGAKL